MARCPPADDLLTTTALATVRAYNSLDLVYDAAQRAAAIYR